MPFNKHDNILFIHIPKNAGKFVEDNLNMSSFPGKVGNMANRSKVGLLSRSITKYFDRKSQSSALTSLSGVYDQPLQMQHLTLQEIQLFGFIENIDTVNMITTVRNPYKRFMSIYNHMVPYNKRSQQSLMDFSLNWPISLSSSVNHNQLAFKRKQIQFLRNLDGSIPKNLYIAKVEDLEKDLLKFMKQLIKRGQEDVYPVELKLEQQKVSKSRLLSENIVLTDEIKSNIYKNYSDDFEEFGYES